MVWISRLALFAYLVGGWLLPASHFHAHPSHAACDHAAVGHHDPSKHGAAAHAATPEDVHSCCSDSHEHPHPETHVGNPEDDHENAGLVSAASPQHCGGLCALCSARSLCSTKPRNKASFSGSRDPLFLVRFSAPGQIFDALAGAHSSRGPPSIG